MWGLDLVEIIFLGEQMHGGREWRGSFAHFGNIHTGFGGFVPFAQLFMVLPFFVLNSNNFLVTLIANHL